MRLVASVRPSCTARSFGSLLSPRGPRGRLAVFSYHQVLEARDPLRPGEPSLNDFVRDVETIARLSKFPIDMSYGIASIKTKVQLTKRYRQLFNEQTDASACFNKAKPEVDADNPKHYSVACPDAAGNEVVVYHFEQTRTGWKFTGLDNINE